MYYYKKDTIIFTKKEIFYYLKINESTLKYHYNKNKVGFKINELNQADPYLYTSIDFGKLLHYKNEKPGPKRNNKKLNDTYYISLFNNFIDNNSKLKKEILLLKGDK